MTTTPVEDVFLTTRTIANILNITPRTVIRLIKRNELDAYRIGWEWRIRTEDFNNYLKKAKAKGESNEQNHRAFGRS